MSDNADPNDHLSDNEKRALAALSRDKLPPAELEERIVAELKEKRLIVSSVEPGRAGVLRYVTIAAAAVLVFALGFEVGSIRPTTSDDSAQQSGSRQFMLLLFETPGKFQEPQAGRIEEYVSEYSNWARSVAESGVSISGEKLKDEGRELFAGSEGLQTHPTPARSEGRLLAGYFAIEAASLDEALKISSSCPHLKYGGEIELREVDVISESNTD